MTHSPDSSPNDGGTDDPFASTPADSTKPTSVLTERAFHKFLATLNPDREEAGRKYEALRTRLVRFFEWRHCSFPDSRADETLDRVARKIDKGQVISNLLPYLLTVAHNVKKEVWKEDKRRRALENEVVNNTRSRNLEPNLESDEPDHRLICFDRCLESLPADNRKLILSYYQEDGGAKIDWRKQLAEQMGIELNALRIRAHRIRKTLEQCIGLCLAQFAGTKG